MSSHHQPAVLNHRGQDYGYGTASRHQHAAYPGVSPSDGSLRPPHLAKHGAGTTNGGPGNVQVAVPVLEPQPWVRDFWKWLSTNTVGVARVDLRRPTLPYPDQYQAGNLLWASYKGQAGGSAPPGMWRPFGGQQQAGGSKRGSKGYNGTGFHDPQYQQGPLVGGAAGEPYGQVDKDRRYGRPSTPTGARLKITRSFVIRRKPAPTAAGSSTGYKTTTAADDIAHGVSGAVGHHNDAASVGVSHGIAGDLLRKTGLTGSRAEEAPLLDVGGGINLDVDRQKLMPVLRAKICGLVSLKMLPQPLLKVSRSLPLGNSGMSMKLLYEVPLEQLHHFYRPPARLMVRLDQTPGAGLRLTPTGLEFDHTAMKFGKSITMRAAAGLVFPRTLPFDPQIDDFGFKVHRLSIKSLW